MLPAIECGSIRTKPSPESARSCKFTGSTVVAHRPRPTAFTRTKLDRLSRHRIAPRDHRPPITVRQASRWPLTRFAMPLGRAATRRRPVGGLLHPPLKAVSSVAGALPCTDKRSDAGAVGTNTRASGKAGVVHPSLGVALIAKLVSPSVGGRRSLGRAGWRGLLCRGCRSRRCACRRPDPRRCASTPGCRLRGRAARGIVAHLAAGPDESQKLAAVVGALLLGHESSHQLTAPGVMGGGRCRRPATSPTRRA